jgi:hypothetical protein
MAAPPISLRATVTDGEWLLVTGSPRGAGETGSTEAVDSIERRLDAPYPFSRAPELYALATDPSAITSVASSHPEQVATLHTALLDFLERTGVPEEARRWYGADS